MHRSRSTRSRSAGRARSPARFSMSRSNNSFSRPQHRTRSAFSMGRSSTPYIPRSNNLYNPAVFSGDRSRSRSRSNVELEHDLRSVPWTSKSTPRNSYAVIDAMNRATGFELPVEDRYMRRLRMYRNQVLPISTPTCPSGWSRHTKNPQKAIDDFGVAWVDADNYFCGPPGSDESTLYREDDPEYSSPGALTKRIHELTNDIKYAMEPEKYKDTIDKRNKTKEMRKEAFERSKKMRHEAVTKEHESMRNRNEAKIAEIYKEHEFLDPAAAKQKASALYEVAFRCVKNPNSSENKNGCREVFPRVFIFRKVTVNPMICEGC